MPRRAAGCRRDRRDRAALGWERSVRNPAQIYAEWDAKETRRRPGSRVEQRTTPTRPSGTGRRNCCAAGRARTLPADFAEEGTAYVADVANKGETIASRKASQNTLNAFGPLLLELLGSSAGDLAGSNLTLWKGCKGVSADDAAGNYVFYGVREFGMSAIMNGVACTAVSFPTVRLFL